MYYTYDDMYYSQEEKELLSSIMKKNNCSFCKAFDFLPEHVKELLFNRLKDEILY